MSMPNTPFPGNHPPCVPPLLASAEPDLSTLGWSSRMHLSQTQKEENHALVVSRALCAVPFGVVSVRPGRSSSPIWGRITANRKFSEGEQTG
jgi:hypothetical protein